MPDDGRGLPGTVLATDRDARDVTPGVDRARAVDVDLCGDRGGGLTFVQGLAAERCVR
ncbi:hypothetical protein GCM10023200_17980 [Actinomycetospora chlora]|uniref:Uncharacterized protein n=1 Tax=Actinomycetospora chlora TaxID=663608 RepID=A0ABP9AQ64_9PSEU